MGILFAGISALLYGSADFAGGLASRHNTVTSVLLTSQILGLLIALIAAPLLGWQHLRAADMLWGAAAGLVGTSGLGFLYKGLAKGFVAVVAPLAAVVSAAVPVIGGTLLGELPDLSGWLGIGISIPAIFLLAYEPGAHLERGRMLRSLRYGLIAGIGFGASFILISRPAAAAGFWPIVASRAASVTAMLLLIRLLGRRIHVTRTNFLPVAAAGTFDTTATITFVISAQLELLPIVSVVTSLSPGPTVILGRLVLHETLTRARIAGLALALLGVALLSW